MNKNGNLTRKRRPCAIGTGLVALDMVVSANSPGPPRCYAGGSCGNILTALRYLGWDSLPVSRLAPGPATESLLADLREWGVSDRFVTVDDTGSTPIIIQRILRTAAGEPRHTFSCRRCPGCGGSLPSYKPLLFTAAETIASRLPSAAVFFFDRVSRGSLHLAKVSSARGAAVVFEPSGVGDPGLFREAWSVAHIVKYAHERLRDITGMGLRRSDREGVLLEIETLGADGLRYRSRLPKFRTTRWRWSAACQPLLVADSAGAGDWCTAGILDRLARDGVEGLRSGGADAVQEALRFGQALAAWNCGFEGARGGMYRVSRSAFNRQVRKFLGGSASDLYTVEVRKTTADVLLNGLCPTCNREVCAVAPAVTSAPRSCHASVVKRNNRPTSSQAIAGHRSG